MHIFLFFLYQTISLVPLGRRGRRWDRSRPRSCPRSRRGSRPGGPRGQGRHLDSVYNHQRI